MPRRSKFLPASSSSFGMFILFNLCVPSFYNLFTKQYVATICQTMFRLNYLRVTQFLIVLLWVGCSSVRKQERMEKLLFLVGRQTNFMYTVLADYVYNLHHGPKSSDLGHGVAALQFCLKSQGYGCAHWVFGSEHRAQLLTKETRSSQQFSC